MPYNLAAIETAFHRPPITPSIVAKVLTGAALLSFSAWAQTKGIRPKRSILFLWNGGEEKGYSGPRYFVQFSPKC